MADFRPHLHKLQDPYTHRTVSTEKLTWTYLAENSLSVWAAGTRYEN